MTSHKVDERLSNSRLVSAEMCVLYRLGRVTNRFMLPLMLYVPTIGNSLTYFRIESRTFEEEAFISDWSGGDVR